MEGEPSPPPGSAEHGWIFAIESRDPLESPEETLPDLSTRYTHGRQTTCKQRNVRKQAQRRPKYSSLNARIARPRVVILAGPFPSQPSLDRFEVLIPHPFHTYSTLSILPVFHPLRGWVGRSTERPRLKLPSPREMIFNDRNRACTLGMRPRAEQSPPNPLPCPA